MTDWEIRETESFGKGIFATNFIPKWSKIIKVESKVNAFEESALSTHCSSCLKELTESSVQVQCILCEVTHYCDKNCLSNDLEYHHNECILNINYLNSSSNTLPSRSIRLFLRFMHHITSASVDHPDFSHNTEHINEEMKILWSQEIEDLLKFLPNLASNSIETLLKYRSMLKSNSFLMRQRDSGDVLGSQFIETHARINNSCQPNCISSHDGQTAFLIAIRDINPEEEITICYTNSTLCRGMRQRYLKTNLLFDCQCNLCGSEEFELPEAYRTARICSCGKLTLDEATVCSECSIEVFNFSFSDLNDLLTKFYSLPSIDKFNVFKMLHSNLHEAHWIINKMADNLIHEFCTDSEYIREMPGLLVDLQTGRVRGDQTISNPFTIIARLEYVISLLSRDYQTIPTAQAIFPVYLRTASRLKGANDEYFVKLVQLYTHWNEKYGPTTVKLIQ